MNNLKTCVGIWTFKPIFGDRSIPEVTKSVVDKIGWLLDGLEYNFPVQIDENNHSAILGALDGKRVYSMGLGTFAEAKFNNGAFVNPDPKLRVENMATAKRGIDLAGKLGSRFTIWPGREGYSHSFEANYSKLWKYFIDGISELVEYANSRNVTILLEHSNSKPPMKLLMRNIGMTMYTIHKVQEAGIDTSNLKINMDWQHLIANGENLAEYAALLSSENLLGHQHGNTGWGQYNDYQMVGSSFFMQILELATVLQDVGYGNGGEWVGFDLIPFYVDPMEHVKRSIIQWEYIYELAGRIDRKLFKEVKDTRNAPMGQEMVFETLGLDRTFIEKLKERKN